ncbi:Ig-like domain-containing protein [Galbibacter mesophilus]|uniref:Ig-like domain-containing protein n=1 Tax=Galbibacter mesophilus TaxID=379069 RepID=UPI0019203206|nr:Ig-like domain-containing protein [Galbibacter mesophilus]MCM5662722.1 Ig-like domain-containing protein [Galbibacter mesophilus]
MKHQNKHIKQLLLGVLLMLGYQVSAQFVLQAPETNSEDGTISNYQWYVLDGTSKQQMGTNATQEIFIPGVYFATYDGTKCGSNATTYFIVTYCDAPYNEVTLDVSQSVSANASVTWNRSNIPNGTLNPQVTATKDIERYIASLTKGSSKKDLPSFRVVCLREKFDLVDDLVTSVENTGTIITMLDNDIAIPSIGSFQLTQPSNGTVRINNNGTPNDPSDDTITYTPGPGFTGEDEFTYSLTIFNSDNTELTDTATITIEVLKAMNDQLVVEEDSQAGPDNQIAVSANDNISDGGSDGNDYEIVTPPSNGTVTEIADGIFEYVPNPNFNGIDSFSYNLTDTSGNTVRGNVNVQVTPQNDAPVAVDDFLSIPANTETPLVVLSNDSDPDGDTISIDNFSEPQHGVLSLENGQLIYYPDLDFEGQDSFTYTITDGSLISNQATVTLTVDGLEDDEVVLRDDNSTTEEDTPVTIQILSNDLISVTSYRIEIENDEGADESKVIVQGRDNIVTYTPEPDFVGTDTFKYVVYYTDKYGVERSKTAVVTIEVTPIQDVEDDFAEVDSSFPFEEVIEILANDTFHPESSLTITNISNPQNGTVTINPDNTLTYLVDPGFEGSDVFTYTVRITHSNGTFNEEQGTITINAQVENVDPAPPPEEEEIRVHQLVSPNGDGQNDELKIYGIENYPNNSVKIFNRWGVLVYETESYGQGNNVFRGYSEGRVTVSQKNKLPVGTYYYVIDYIQDQHTKNMAGYFYINY